MADPIAKSSPPIKVLPYTTCAGSQFPFKNPSTKGAMVRRNGTRKTPTMKPIMSPIQFWRISIDRKKPQIPPIKKMINAGNFKRLPIGHLKIHLSQY